MTVELQTGEKKRMDELQLGDRIRTGPNQFAKVFFFSHQDDKQLMPSVRIRTENKELVLSASHYVLHEGSLKAAGELQIGDMLLDLEKDEAVEIISLEFVTTRGAFAPHTDSQDGQLIVEGLLVSEFTTAVHPTTAHLLLRIAKPLLRLLNITHIPHNILLLISKALHLPSGPTQIS